MGSPISAVVANLYMEFFEQEALNSVPVKPVYYDTFCIVKKGSEFFLVEPVKLRRTFHKIHNGIRGR